jgi:hypothetical protein
MAPHTACLLSRCGVKEIGEWVPRSRTDRPASINNAARPGQVIDRPASHDHHRRRIEAANSDDLVQRIAPLAGEHALETLVDVLADPHAMAVLLDKVRPHQSEGGAVRPSVLGMLCIRRSAAAVDDQVATILTVVAGSHALVDVAGTAV